MNERFRELAQLAVADAAKYCQRPFDLSREENETFAMSFAELMIREFEEYLTTEIDRLSQYRNSIPEFLVDRIEDVDICIEKCYDNLQGIRQRFGIEE
jgi:predicted Zn-dependent protease